MISKMIVLSAFAVAVYVGYYAFGYYQHKWGYDDSTVIHQVGGTSFSMPHDVPDLPTALPSH